MRGTHVQASVRPPRSFRLVIDKADGLEPPQRLAFAIALHYFLVIGTECAPTPWSDPMQVQQQEPVRPRSNRTMPQASPQAEPAIRAVFASVHGHAQAVVVLPNDGKR